MQYPEALSFAASHIAAPEDDASRYKLELPGASPTELDEPEEETLGQRIKRMKEEKSKGMSGDFATDVSSQLGLQTGENRPTPSKTLDAEETLGQRRQRLKEEAAARPQLQPRRSMADILQHNPAGVRQVSYGSQDRTGQLSRLNTNGPTTSSTPQLNKGFSMPQLPPHMATHYNRAPYMNPSGNASSQVLNPAFGMNGYYPYGAGMQAMGIDPMGPPLDPQQRAMIDRWRQGIL